MWDKARRGEGALREVLLADLLLDREQQRGAPLVES
jgi:hypothetical protein